MRFNNRVVKMGMFKKYIYALWLCGVAVLTGCAGGGCIENRSSIPLAQFYSYDEQMTPLAIDSISIYGIGQPTDSLLLSKATDVSQVYLPLRFTHDTTQYVIRYEQKALSSPRYNDTLTFIYQPRPYFESIDCGAMYNYVIDTCQYTRHVLDSVAVIKAEITNENTESVRIFYTIQR